MYDLTMVNMYTLGDNGKSGIPEEYLNDIRGLSKMDLFKSLQVAVQEGLINDISSQDGREWMLTQNGIMYTKALIEQI